MSRMNSRTRKKWYNFLVSRDGEYCKFCRVTPLERKIRIDHKDNDNSHNFAENLQLVCQRCNYLKNPRRPLDKSVCENEDPTEISINRTKEPIFRKYVHQRMDEEEEIYESDLIYSGAEHCGMSSESAKRYLKKMYSSAGKLERMNRVMGRTIRYKPKSKDC